LTTTPGSGDSGPSQPAESGPRGTGCPRAGPVAAATRRTPIPAKLFVGNLSFQTTREQLTELFGSVGRLVEVFLPTDRDTGRPRGFGFVEYETEADAQEAIRKFNGYELDGRALRVNEAEARPPRAARPFVPRGDDGGGGFFGGGGGKPFKAKGSRRNLRARKRGGF
jgi:RNA recognition motif-containing protein